MPVWDLEEDAARIRTSFRQAYGIEWDEVRGRISFAEFVALVKVKNPYDRRVAYLRELVAEPDIIETDYPSEFIGLPWSRDAIHALQEAAMRSHRTNLK